MELERSRDLDRVLTFVDAIVAIAITLLILPLVDIANDHDGGTADLLRDHAGQLGAFALSFLVILRFWWGQHRMLRNVVKDDRLFDVALIFWAFTIVFLPFPTALAADGADDVATRALYIGTMAVSALALTAIAWSLTRNPELTGGLAAPSVVPVAVIAGLFLVALVLSVAVDAVGYLSLLLLFLAGPMESLLQRRAGSGAAAR
ncbi:DUF1211 domain-containing protein [Rhodococcus triatomae]|uniref:Uncharacterized membrane protein n=1 Tax=Rhodococcus triatomae TaxID=300028 RepID=A0A1G8AYZ4_9NOCA|nr:TMEM175 family protein [Rhodococcus triatomae]QNG17636.1 DUF1211 domain-containing protein [Rhodococcus triatomae]QNG22697.1 DUF1211 domain-containing protein [Rhodococcus triatomae]SDH26066.1 Uncharacterized membrane protein [Rhodococcus triatomae]